MVKTSPPAVTSFCIWRTLKHCICHEGKGQVMEGERLSFSAGKTLVSLVTLMVLISAVHLDLTLTLAISSHNK